ncbi:hypothetical protein SAMN05421890_1879 [Ensifer adhaerens]|nr:hypothetical protein SAMN05421890_1879 [Ensifer adhaerens]
MLNDDPTSFVLRGVRRIAAPPRLINRFAVGPTKVWPSLSPQQFGEVLRAWSTPATSTATIVLRRFAPVSTFHAGIISMDVYMATGTTWSNPAAPALAAFARTSIAANGGVAPRSTITADCFTASPTFRSTVISLNQSIATFAPFRHCSSLQISGRIVL